MATHALARIVLQTYQECNGSLPFNLKHPFMNKLFKSSLVLLLFSFSMIIFQISCEEEADAVPSTTSTVKPTGLIYFFKYGANQQVELWTAKYDGSDQKSLVTLTSGKTFFEEGGIGVSPDGTKIFFTVFETAGNIEFAAIYSVNADGSGLTKVIGANSQDAVFAAVW